MKNIGVLGAGKIGETIVDLLSNTDDFNVTLIDQCESRLNQLKATFPNIKSVCCDVNDTQKLESVAKDKFALLNACPFDIKSSIATVAAKSGTHYLDLSEDVANTRIIRALAKGSSSAFIPQCGLAPGFISIVAFDLAKQFEQLHKVHLRVGALPRHPSNALKYNLTWSTEGLINEYLKPCEAIVNGELKEMPPLEELEHFSLDGDNYEAFNTSGGLGTLCETLEGKVHSLNYRSIRYPGHRDILKLLLKDLRLGEKPELVKDIFENALPITTQDVVIVFADVSGTQNGQFIEKSFAQKIYGKNINGRHRNAIQITTASSICAVLDLLCEKRISQSGFIKQEEINFEEFCNNRFGKLFLSNEDEMYSYPLSKNIKHAEPRDTY